VLRLVQRLVQLSSWTHLPSVQLLPLDPRKPWNLLLPQATLLVLSPELALRLVAVRRRPWPQSVLTVVRRKSWPQELPPLARSRILAFHSVEQTAAVALSLSALWLLAPQSVLAVPLVLLPLVAPHFGPWLRTQLLVLSPTSAPRLAAMHLQLFVSLEPWRQLWPLLALWGPWPQRKPLLKLMPVRLRTLTPLSALLALQLRLPVPERLRL